MIRKKQSGFTLVELMVVIVLIGLLAGVVGVKVIPIIFKGKKTTALSQMKELKSAIEIYYMHESRYPEDLAELTQATTENPDGYMEQIPQDPWGEDYVYLLAAVKAIATYVCDGTDDDVSLDQQANRNQPQ